MSEAAFAVLMLLVLAWAVASHLLTRVNITGALVFLAAGYTLGNPTWGLLAIDVTTPSMHVLAELTLALLLFTDASRVNVSQLRRDVYFPSRLLGIGLPLSIVLGSLAAAWMFDDFSWALAGFVGATLAPTDAALSAQVINDDRVPMRLRRALNVESGLNDGIATPIVAFTLAVVAGDLGLGHHGDSPEVGALLELALGVGVGLVVGVGSVVLISLGSRRKWVAAGGRRLATLGAALASFALAAALDGNGFIAAFVAGIVFGARLPPDVAEVEEVGELPELLGELLALAVWFLFGAALLPVALDHFSASVLVYALLSLTVIRMIPVGIALLGAGMDRSTVLFVGWFGPRGLASVVFILLAVEELGETPLVGQAVSVVAVTVVLSVVLHGVSAGPLGRRYVARREAGDDADAPRSRRPGHLHASDVSRPRAAGSSVVGEDEPS
ncbi:cation:proton antiporter domain-containing protein [Nocardioides bizhenqiangii]|uniref:Cation:proton antiporter n=1 Tax=Nocardioides bizhenqiangii TaxID=3095076 RepID=A0ABZ0ZUW6_9ACTN|nr:cation:proton antiporter [Nocardioides sp. HM61]WQQ28038.1 cation:proton antiporter [Nocardioides sp. HM61]